MPPLPPLTDTLISDAMINAVKMVFNTMARMDATLSDKASTVEDPAANAEMHIIGNVGFGGDINGLVYVCMPEEFCLTVTSNVLGMDRMELASLGPDAVKDTIGELTNMIVGTFKNRLVDLGYPSKLTVPTIVRGRGLSICSIKGANRKVFHFEVRGVRISTDLHMHVGS